MGQFSWNTSDTKKPIMNNYTSKCKTVYFLQPDGKHIKEDSYDGYGNFGGIDVYEWLAERNAPELCKKGDTEHNRLIGMAMENISIGQSSGFYRDIETEAIYSYNFHEILDEVKPFDGNYGSEFKNGLTYNEEIEKGILVDVNPFKNEIKWTLKFSYDPNANYDELSTATHAKNQGFC